jgi:HK97 family phage prohead protease
MMNRAYSVLSLKEMDEETRVFKGIATTPSTDRVGDIVESKGAVYKLPIPLLWQHRHAEPIGEITSAKMSSSGIEVVGRILRATTSANLIQRLDEAWESVRLGLVKGLSIGFNPIEYSYIDDGKGVRFTKWNWLELSCVTIPANADASITAIKSIDRQLLAASGQKQFGGVPLIPGVSGQKKAASRGPVQLIPRTYK